MNIRKGTKIVKVSINHGRVSAMTVCNDQYAETALSRTQRRIFTQYDDPDFEENVVKEFGNSKILDDAFVIEKDGIVVYRR